MSIQFEATNWVGWVKLCETLMSLSNTDGFFLIDNNDNICQIKKVSKLIDLYS